MGKNRSGFGAEPSQRQLRVAELVRRALAEALMHSDDPVLDEMSITVSEVRISPDLRVATAYVLPLGGQAEHTQRACIGALSAAKNTLRRAVSRQLALKYSPDLRFVIDSTFDRMDRMRALLASTHVARDLE